MNTKRWIALAALAALAVVVAILLLTARHREWTTSSPQALAAFTRGLEALDKVYRSEARADFAKAVALDPSFLAAKLFLSRSSEEPSHDPAAAALLDSLSHANLSGLTARERFLIRYVLAEHAKETVKADQILHAYAKENPDDPYALEALASAATARQDWGEARRLLTRLIDVAPNRVSAYNQLGYLAMGQGQFAEAARMFETYRYIAPDQANPHDSLGELDIITGHYVEARKELDEALRIKPDFCASSAHLVSLALLERQPAQADQALAAAARAGGCTALSLQEMRCSIAVWTPLLAGDWNGVWRASQGECAAKNAVFAVWAALRTGRTAAADAMIAERRDHLATWPTGTLQRRYMEAELAHLEGARALLAGNAADAAQRFRYADAGITYGNLGEALFKLINRHALAAALRAAGVRDEAATVLAEARAVNAPFIDLLTSIPPAPATR